MIFYDLFLITVFDINNNVPGISQSITMGGAKAMSIQI